MQDSQGKVHRFKDVPAGSTGRQQVFTNEKWGLVDAKGNVVVPFASVTQANQWAIAE